jgi:hypothetical protein
VLAILTLFGRMGPLFARKKYLYWLLGMSSTSIVCILTLVSPQLANPACTHESSDLTHPACGAHDLSPIYSFEEVGDYWWFTRCDYLVILRPVFAITS